MNSRLFKAAGVTASFFALFLLLGGHWFALQSLAWARMFVEFSKSESFTGAVEKTLDGKHPCKMCLRIQEGRQHEQQQQQKLPLLKSENLPELFCESRQTEIPPAPAAATDPVAFVPNLHADHIMAPPTPPPRFFGASANCC